MRLYEYAKILRSKNSGPFEITLDILFDDPEKYKYIKAAGILNEQVVAHAYQIPVSDIHHFVYFDQGLGIKITMARLISSGSPGDRDVYGTQQYAPIMNLEIEEGV